MLACVAQVFMFLSLKHAMLHGAYKRPDEPWSAEQTFKLFMIMALLTLLITVSRYCHIFRAFDDDFCGLQC